MRGRHLVWIAALAVVAVLGGPAAAQQPPQPPQPGDEIEMDPEPAQPKPKEPPKPPPAPPAPPAQPAQPQQGQGEPAVPPEPPAAPVKDPKVAKKWLTTGQQLIQKGDWFTSAKRADDAKASYANAATAFEKSIEAGDDLNTYALLADAEEKLGKVELAVKHYRVVVKAQAGIRPDVLKKATARLDELSTKVGIITLTVKPDGAVITLAGTELGKSPLAEPLILLPGTYPLSFQADGFQPREAELNVEAGAEAERTFELEAVKIIVVAPPPPEPPPPPPPPPSRIPLYAGAGATAALLGTAAVTGILAIRQHGTYVSRGATAVERADAKSNGQTLALVTDVTLATGLVAGGFTAYWYFYKYKPAQQKRMEELPAGGPSAKVDVVPWVQPGASGLTLVGVF